MSPLRIAVLAQALGALATFALARLAFPDLLLPLFAAGSQGLFAALTSYLLKAPAWWLPIHLAFMPLVVLASRLELDPAWYLGGFLLLLAIFWRTDRSRVPLYLSNAATAAAVATALPPGPGKFVDLGCGDGALLRRLARLRPDCQFLGIEHAPLPWLWARLAAIGLANCQIRHGDFWRQTLGPFDLVYAFLSPAPMPRLWAKARAEMKPSALLVSNSFPVPGVRPENTLEVADRRATQLFCYLPGDQLGP
jgi:SAM-dependent methyltransferase